jgi:hypothetical protein
MASTSDRRDSRRLTGSTSPSFGRRLLLAGPAANFAIDSLKPDRRHQSCTHKITTFRSKLVALWVGPLCIPRELLRILNYDGLGSTTALSSSEFLSQKHLVAIKGRKRNLPVHPDGDQHHDKNDRVRRVE